MDATQDGAELEVLDAEECYRLLRTQQVGRIGLVARGNPLVLPVNYGLDGDVLVLRTGQGPLLEAADHANVAFEVDEFDAVSRSGWSVLVRGLAEEVTGAHREELVARTRASGVQPWAPGERGHWVRVIPQGISGRRIRPGELPGGHPGLYL